jgi:hypothetical protein
MNRAGQMLSEAQNRRCSTTGHVGVQASRVADIVATAPVGGRAVILSVRLTNGLVHHFGIEPDRSSGLRTEMEAAENSAREQGKQTRQ